MFEDEQVITVVARVSNTAPGGEISGEATPAPQPILARLCLTPLSRHCPALWSALAGARERRRGELGGAAAANWLPALGPAPRFFRAVNCGPQARAAGSPFHRAAWSAWLRALAAVPRGDRARRDTP